MNPGEIEDSYKEFTNNFQKWVPDGVINVNLQLLQELGLLTSSYLDQTATDVLAHQFHVVETNEKVTLFNEQFAVWIIPQPNADLQSTMTMVALIQNEKPHLEIVFRNSGVYNSPRYILKVLEHFLSEVIDTEAVITSIGKKNFP